MPVSIKHLEAMLREPPELSLDKVIMMAEWKDTLFYKVTNLHRVHKDRTRAYVSFEDGSSHWVEITDLHMQMNMSLSDKFADKLIVCCICDSDLSRPPNDIVICDICEQGYHQQCHMPPIGNEVLKEGVEFDCRTCQRILNQTPNQVEQVVPASDEVKKSQPRKSLPVIRKKTPKRKRASEIEQPSRENDLSKQKARRKPLITRIKLPQQPSKTTNRVTSSVGGSNDDSSTDEEKDVENLKSGGTLEKVDEIIVKSAKKIVDHKDGIATTEEFVRLVSPM